MMTAVGHVAYKLSIISLLLLLSLLWGGTIVVAKPNNGFTTPLIHILSPASPIYPGNISYEEEIERLLRRSNARMQYLDATIASALSNNMSQTTKNPLDEMIRPRVEFYPFGTYIIQVGLGTFDVKFPARPSKSYYLYTDTGSHLIWTLCEDCEKQKPQPKCFQTRDPPFPNSQSKSYKPLPCGGHPLCKPGQCKGEFCSEDVLYGDGSGVRTILGGETFTFLTSSGRSQAIENIVFGCAYDVTGDMGFGRNEDFKIAGLLGLGYAPASFPVQTSHLIDGTFSFCLTRQREIQTYLRFGSDIPQPLGERVTQLVLFDGVPFYFVNLNGVSVDGHKLLINPTAFEIRKQGKEGGCIMDNGSSFTYLITPVYKALLQFVEYHFLRYPNFIRVPSPIYPEVELCYNWTPPPREAPEALPTITFHFEGDNHPNIDVRPDDGFIKLKDRSGRDILCLAFVQNDVRTTFGSMQLSNYRFIYDLNRRLLKFAPEDCARNS